MTIMCSHGRPLSMCAICAVEAESKMYKEKIQHLEAELAKRGLKNDPEDIHCPFCNEGGFDKEGLKGHITYGDCTEYDKTKRPNRLCI